MKHRWLLLLLCVSGTAAGHGIADDQAAFVAGRAAGPWLAPWLYLGARHMLTGWDHLLFVLGIVFFLRRWSQLLLLVTLFSVGHSLTLMAGVLGGIHADAHLVDLVIGLSVVYIAVDNLDGWRSLLGIRPDARLAVAGFGLVHGFGLATSVQALAPAQEGLTGRLAAFNAGVELGQLAALSVVLVLIAAWRRRAAFERQAVWVQAALMGTGFLLAGRQLAAFVLPWGATS